MSSVNPQLVPIIKDEEIIRKTILTNTVKMLISRGYMKKENWSSDKINNLIDIKTDNNIYNIPLDVNYNNESSDIKDFDGSQIIVKIFPNTSVKIDSNSNLSYLDSLKGYDNYHKIIIFNAISEKSYDHFRKIPNIEVFDKKFLMINLAEIVSAPISYTKISEEDIKHISNPKLFKLLENDPASRYYNLKRGDIVRIIRASRKNSEAIVYRRVI